MENFEQNQNNENLENVVEDEFSTVFSAPVAHKKTADKVKNNNVKRWISVISGVLAVAILITGTFFIVKLIPEKEQEQAPINSQVPEKKILSVKEADFKNITVVNKNGTFAIDNTVSKDESGYNNCVWSLKGYSSAVIGDTPLYNVASVLMNLSYIREIENVTDVDYGFDKPISDVTITKQDNTVHRSIGESQVDITHRGRNINRMRIGAAVRPLHFCAMQILINVIKTILFIIFQL